MIYERIHEYCRKESISITEFERRCQIGNGVVGKWKKGKTEPSIRILEKIQNATGLSIGYWVGGSL